MKLSEHIKMEISNCDETNPSKIRKFLIEKIGVEVPIIEIKKIQAELLAITSPKDRKNEYKNFFKTKYLCKN